MRTLLAEEIEECRRIAPDYQIHPQLGRESFTVLTLDRDLNLKIYEVDVVDETCTCKGYQFYRPENPHFLCRHLKLCLNYRENEEMPDEEDPAPAPADDAGTSLCGLPGTEGPRRGSESGGHVALPHTVRGHQPGTHKAPYRLCLATRLTAGGLSDRLPAALRRKCWIGPYPGGEAATYPRCIHEAWAISPEDVRLIESLLLPDENLCTCTDFGLDVDCPVPEHNKRAWTLQKEMGL